MAKKLKIKKKKVLKVTKEETPVTENKCTDLREVMDYDRPFRMIYSGVENEQYFNLLYNMGIRDFLMSYHYIKEKHMNMSRYKGKNVKFLIDSGAHTYQNDLKYQDYDIDYWENHLRNYLNWAKKNREYIYAIVSFDFENLVGADVVSKWYNQYFEPFMLETGIPVCFVWHQNSSMSWEQYCQRYPYVGFSSVNTEGVAIDLQEYIAKLNIASKYNTLVHGFGMTRTAMLTKVPFYTSDSTTWLVGLQYGEVNYWTGTKMTRLKKEKWKGEYLSKLVDLGLDEQKLLDEDTAELIKANIKAFLEAQKYIDTKLRPRMYWLKPKSQVQSVSDINFPDPTWLRLEAPTDATDWAKKLNINPELPLADLMVMIQDATIFINWDDDKYADFRDEFYNDDYIHQAHTLWVNTVVTDREQKVKDLCDFFTECVEGKNDKLLVYGTGFDRQAKERDHYMEEEEFDYEDMTEDELQYVLSNSGLLPEPKEDGTAPEIDELDDEIFKDLDIVPVRDEKGRFLKGQKAVRKPKKVYSKKYPKLFCDTCYSAQTCPEYKQGMVCAFKKMFNRFDTRNQEDVMDAMASMVEMNLDRLQRASIFEMLDGGLPNNIVTNLISQNMQMLNQMANLNLNLPKEVIKQTHTVRSDGSRETVTQVSNAGASGGILAELFKDMKSATEDNDDDVQDIMAEKEKSDKDNAIEVEGKEVKE